MQGPSCAKEIPDRSRFCLHCGVDLGEAPTATRPAIDGFSLIRNYIPRDLAERILTAGKHIESERRLVTILFVDVTGFTALSEKLDPENVTAVLNDCFTSLITTILRYEGTIDKFIGDGIMAMFGAPHAHENDTERAVRCALDMAADLQHFNARRAADLPDPLGLHIGLHSGMVIAGNVGSDERMNYSVIGDTVNLASRLVEIAPRGEIYLSAETYDLVANVVVAEGPSEMHLRGKSAPVFVYKLRSLRTEEERRTLHEIPEEMVGRGSELAIVDRDLDRAVHQSPVHLLIRGEPGIGKTRLTIEIVRKAKERGLSCSAGACSNFETTTPYYLWSMVLRDLLQVGHDAEETILREALQRLISTLSLHDHEPYLAALLGIRYESIMFVDDHVRKQRTFNGVRALLRAAAQRQPSLFVIEDLHWFDPHSRELLEEMIAPAFDSIPGMFVLTFRDDYPFVKLLEHAETLIDLNRLDRANARLMMLRQLQADTVPPVLEEFIMQRSEGNPFFLHEVITTLLDSKKVSVRWRRVEPTSEQFDAAIPSSVQGMIMARIDSLQDSVKEVLFCASVIGREFSRALLEGVVNHPQEVETALEELQRSALILEKPGTRPLDYEFKHLLIQEVAYQTMLLNKRKELHTLIAGAIEKLHADHLGDYCESLAFHYEKAEVWDKAAEYLSRSGSKMRQAYTKEQSEKFLARTPAAIRKLYQSPNAEPGFGPRLRAVAPHLIVMLIPAALLTLFGRSVFALEDDAVVPQIVFSAVALLILLWYGLSLWYLGIVPFLRGNPRLYDLLEDRIRVLYRNSATVSIHFSEIERLQLWDAKSNALRSLRYRILDPLGRLDGTQPLTARLWLREVLFSLLPPYSFGAGSGRAAIHVRLNAGHTVLRFLLPWLHSPLRSRVLSLHPLDTKEFYVQCEVALLKWWKKQV